MQKLCRAKYKDIKTEVKCNSSFTHWASFTLSAWNSSYIYPLSFYLYKKLNRHLKWILGYIIILFKRKFPGAGKRGTPSCRGVHCSCRTLVICVWPIFSVSTSRHSSNDNTKRQNLVNIQCWIYKANTAEVLKFCPGIIRGLKAMLISFWVHPITVVELLFQRTFHLTNWRQFFYASVLLLMINCVITLSKWLWNYEPQASGSTVNFDNVMTKFILNRRTDA